MRDFANLHVRAWLLRGTGGAGLAMVFAVLLAFLAPFGTYRLDVVELVGYWTVQMAAWLVLSQSASWLVARAPGLRTRALVHQRIATVLIAALPMMVITGSANNMISGWQPDPGELAELFVSISLIGGAYVLIADWLLAGLTNSQISHALHPVAEERPINVEVIAPTTEGDPNADTALMDRLPAHLREGILCLQVEDHYVRVHGLNGSAMVLIRFSDALRGISHVPGSQVHRSWWVAADAVAAFRRTGRTAQLTLSDGTLVPVSQPYLAYAMRLWGNMEMAIT